MSAEKRQHDRKDYAIPLRVEIDGELLDGSTTNVSLGGFRAEFSREVPFGAKVKVHVRFPALSEESVIDAEVRWTQRENERCLVGLQFLRVRARETWALNQLVRG